MDRKRVLFVDDEPLVLRMLERLMHTTRDEWDSVFVGSGRAALQALEQTSFDVVVSDMRMPHMDGAELLNAVRERQPRTMRFILSAYADRSAVCRCVGSTHQFLTKPIDLPTLRTSLGRALGLQSVLQQPELQTAVARVQTLPVLPALYSEMLERLRDPRTGTLEIGRIVARDLALAATILKLVNSAFFGFESEIVEIHEAVNYLGIEIIKSLVLSFGIFEQFERGRIPTEFMESLWQHSLATASAARTIAVAQGAPRRLQDESFTAGLLHDLGKLVLAAEDATIYLHRDPATPLHILEKERFGACHGQIGGYLLGLWGLPAAIVEAVGLHHSPRLTGAPVFSALTAVHVANAVLPTLAASGSSLAPAVDPTYLAAIGVQEHLDSWIAALQSARSGAANS